MTGWNIITVPIIPVPELAKQLYAIACGGAFRSHG